MLRRYNIWMDEHDTNHNVVAKTIKIHPFLKCSCECHGYE